MTHLHKASGMYFECGELMEEPRDGVRRTYDITVITHWQDNGEELNVPVIIDFYFGDYDPRLTDYYIDRWFEKQVANNKLDKLVRDCKDIVDAYWLTNKDYLPDITKKKVLATHDNLAELLNNK